MLAYYKHYHSPVNSPVLKWWYTYVESLIPWLYMSVSTSFMLLAHFILLTYSLGLSCVESKNTEELVTV